jgi:hypothetical protein
MDFTQRVRVWVRLVAVFGRIREHVFAAFDQIVFDCLVATAGPGIDSWSERASVSPEPYRIEKLILTIGVLAQLVLAGPLSAAAFGRSVVYSPDGQVQFTVVAPHLSRDVVKVVSKNHAGSAA